MPSLRIPTSFTAGRDINLGGSGVVAVPVVTLGTKVSALAASVLAAGDTLAALPAPALTLGSATPAGGTLAADTYFWKITAINALGETTGSNEVTAALDELDSQALSWITITGATGYNIYRGTVTNTQDTLVASVGEVTAYEDIGAAGTPDTVPETNTTHVASEFDADDYFWKLTAINALGETTGSNEITVSLDAEDSQELTWDAVTGATGYLLYRGLATGAQDVLVATLGEVTSYEDTGEVEEDEDITVPVANTSNTPSIFAADDYFWKLTAITNEGETTASNELTATLADLDTQVINWSAITNATGYKLYRGTATGVTNKLIATLGLVTTYKDVGLVGTTASPPVVNTAAYVNTYELGDAIPNAVVKNIKNLSSLLSRRWIIPNNDQHYRKTLSTTPTPTDVSPPSVRKAIT